MPPGLAQGSSPATSPRPLPAAAWRGPSVLARPKSCSLGSRGSEGARERPSNAALPPEQSPLAQEEVRRTAGRHWTPVRREHPDTALGWAPVTWTLGPALRQGRFCPRRAPKQDTPLPTAFRHRPGALRGSEFWRLRMNLLAADTERSFLDWGALEQTLLPAS